jgi:predicted DNA-binding transcriptional regulator AlpA
VGAAAPAIRSAGRLIEARLRLRAAGSRSFYQAVGGGGMSRKTSGCTGWKLNSTQLARALVISRAQVWKLLRAGRLPGPVRNGEAVPRWSYDELRDWVRAGCPDRTQWGVMKFLRARLRRPGSGVSSAPPATSQTEVTNDRR